MAKRRKGTPEKKTCFCSRKVVSIGKGIPKTRNIKHFHRCMPTWMLYTTGNDTHIGSVTNQKDQSVTSPVYKKRVKREALDYDVVQLFSPHLFVCSGSHILFNRNRNVISEPWPDFVLV